MQNESRKVKTFVKWFRVSEVNGKPLAGRPWAPHTSLLHFSQLSFQLLQGAHATLNLYSILILYFSNLT